MPNISSAKEPNSLRIIMIDMVVECVLAVGDTKVRVATPFFQRMVKNLHPRLKKLSQHVGFCAIS